MFGLRPFGLAAALLLWAGAPVRAEEHGASGALRVSAGAGFDSNALRTYDSLAPDAEASLVGSADGRTPMGPLALSGGYDFAVRKFMLFATEDTLIQSASGEAAWPVRPWLRPGLTAAAKDRRGSALSYSDLSARLFVDYAPDPTVQVTISGGARRFLYWPSFIYTYSAGEGGIEARYRFDRRHSVRAFGELSHRSFGVDARPPPEGTSSPRRRADDVLGAGVGYSYRGPFTASVSYAFYEHGSNSYGERLLRHRLTVTGAVRLWWRFLLLGQGVLQLTAYPDGVYLSPEQHLAEDDENHSSASIKLSRPITDQLDFELRYSIYREVLPTNGRQYSRQVGWTGFTFRL